MEPLIISESPRLIERRKAQMDPALRRRIEVTVSCRDCDDIPKVSGAGEIFPEAGTLVQRMHNGVKVIAGGYDGAAVMEMIQRLKGHHEPQEEKAFYAVMKALGSARTMIELGAYWSYYSLWFLQEFPQARSILVEPDPYNLEIGKINFRLNHREGTFIQAAVAATSSGPQPLRCESDGDMRSIPRVSVDDLVRTLKLETVDVLFADIQGAETTMLDGIVESVRQGLIRYVVISTHHYWISGDYRTHQKCLDKIRELGGTLVVEHTVEESYSGDGLIIASFGKEKPLDISLSYNRHKNSLFGSSEDEIAEIHDKLPECLARQSEMEKQAKALQAQLGELGWNKSEMAQKIHTARKAFQLRLVQDDHSPRFNFYRSPWSLFREYQRAQVGRVARHRAASLRAENRTEIVCGLHGIFEVHRHDQVITSALKADLQWEMPLQERAVRIVERETNHLLRESVLLDLGANIGVTGIQMVFSGLMKRCLAVEADPDNFALLQSNVNLNGLGHLFHLNACAVGLRDGTVGLDVNPLNTGDHQVRPDLFPYPEDPARVDTWGKIEIPMRRLDRILEECPDKFKKNIGLVWMDVQGFEANVVEGGLHHLQAHRWPCVMEFWPAGLQRVGYDQEKVMRLLSSIWNRFLVLDTPGQEVWGGPDSLKELWNHHVARGDFVNLLCLP